MDKWRVLVVLQFFGAADAPNLKFKARVGRWVHPNSLIPMSVPESSVVVWKDCSVVYEVPLVIPVHVHLCQQEKRFRDIHPFESLNPLARLYNAWGRGSCV